MATVLEARAVISAEDKTGAAFAAIEARMAELAKAAANISRAAAPAAAAENFARVATPLSQATTAVSKYADAMGDAARKSREFQAAQQNFRQAIRDGEASAWNPRAAARGRMMAQIGSLAGTAGLIATPFIAHESMRLAREVRETYREFDRERRFAKAVMGLTDAEQAPLVQQAIHGGATTKYNDIQFLEAQRELAARGLKRDQILGVMPAAADLGQSLGLDLPSAVKQMEGAIFGFKKDVSSIEAAAASARQTADIQVKAAKISGMTPEDLTQLYKFGATPARLAGVSEQNLLAFGAISKKANMGGDEAGVAFRALMAAATVPTAGAKTAMRANGMRYADYQRAPDRLALEPFVGDIAERYGVKLDKAAQSALGKIFNDKAVISSPEKFTPAVLSVLRDVLGGKDAKSLKSIAGEAGRYRMAAMQAVDVNALVRDLMLKLPGNLALANALFGREQGARIANAFGDPETFRQMLEELVGHSDGYAKKVADERMAGFDGAVSRFEGAIKNVETALGRSMDRQLTGGYDAAAKVLQAFAELPDGAHRAAIELAAVAVAAVTFTGALKALSIANRLDGGPGIKAPGLVGTGGALLRGLSLASLAYDLWDPKEFEKNHLHNNGPSLSDSVNGWADKNLPWWLRFAGNDADRQFQDWQHAHGGSHFAGQVSPYHEDFTLGNTGGFSKDGRLQPRNNLGSVSEWEQNHLTPGPESRAHPLDKGGVTGDITVTGQATVEFSPLKIEAPPEFIRIVSEVRAAAAQIPLTSTGHPPAALGRSMPEADVGANHGGR